MNVRRLAKYPFLGGLSELAHSRNIDIAKLEENIKIYERAKERLWRAVLEEDLGTRLPHDGDEALSFGLASFMARYVCPKCKRRYAYTEARFASARLCNDSAQEVVEVARALGWNVQRVVEAGKPEFSVHFSNYLSNTVHLRESPEWKLINQPVKLGWVSLCQRSVARLLQEEIQRNIAAKLAGNRGEVSKLPLPDGVKHFIASINREVVKRYPEARATLPSDVRLGAFPPCVQKLCADARDGRHIGHDGRFMLCTFMLNVGMGEDKVVELFSNMSDFNRELTAYYVHHIAVAGCGETYTPPVCSSLRAQGLCVAACGVKHPLVYYRRRCRGGRR